MPNAIRIALLCVFMLVAACSSGLGPTDGLIHRLRNRGAVPLSADNPYLAANLLVSREMESSPEVKGFIQHRGAPSALEVQSGYFSPTLMHFYYTDSREQYTLEDIEGTWIIRGPEIMERDKMKEVAALTRDVQGEPKLAFNTTVPPISGSKQLNTPFPSTPQSKHESSQAQQSLRSGPQADGIKESDSEDGFRSPGTGDTQPRKRREATFPGQGPSVSAEQERELVQDMIRAAGPHPAETTPRGDIVHYVTYPGETLSMISRWYTFDRSNAAKIARINRLADPDHLSIGDSVVIPSYLVRNSTRLSEEAVKALAARSP